MFGQIKNMLADAADGPRSVGEQKLPVGFVLQRQKIQLASYKSRVKSNSIHLPYRRIICVMRKRGFNDQFAHVEVVIILSQQDFVVNALLMVGSEIQWGTKGDLKRAGQPFEH